jgi:hypothetical protein
MGSGESSAHRAPPPRKHFTRLQKKRNEDRLGYAIVWVKAKKVRKAARELGGHPNVVSMRWARKRFKTDPPDSVQVAFEYRLAEVDGCRGLGPLAISDEYWDKWNQTWVADGPDWCMGHPDSWPKDKGA